MMKSQDILILLKLISLHSSNSVQPEAFSVRSIAASTGVSKTEVSASLNRSIDIGLAKYARKDRLPTANSKALFELIAGGLRYVFPAKPGAVGRGKITGLEAPGLEGLLSSLGDYHYVWPDAEGDDKGQVITPLYKTASYAARQDLQLYQFMALVDAIRLGDVREMAIATNELKKRLGV